MSPVSQTKYQALQNVK